MVMEAGFEPAMSVKTPAPKAGGINQATLFHDDNLKLRAQRQRRSRFTTLLTNFIPASVGTHRFRNR